MRRDFSSLRKKGLIILGSAALLAVVYFFLFSKFFKINEVIVTGPQNPSTPEIEDFIKGQALGHNLLFFSKNKLMAALNEKFSFKSLNLDKELPRTLKVALEEPEYAAIWEENGRYYLLEKGGKLSYQINLANFSQNNYPIIENDGSSKLMEEQAIVPEELNLILEAKTKLADQHLIEPDRFIIDDEPDMVKIAAKGGPQIFLDSRDIKGLDDQLAKLEIFLKNKTKDDLNKLQYIDLRFGDKIYFK